MSKITFLGTCACDFSPRLKTDLKDKFDKDARRSSAILIGESTLVDCGMHILDELRISGTDPAKIKDILSLLTSASFYLKISPEAFDLSFFHYFSIPSSIS